MSGKNFTKALIFCTINCTAQADGSVINFAGVWSEDKVRDRLKCRPDGGARLGLPPLMWKK